MDGATDAASTSTRAGLDPKRLGPNYFKLFWASTISNLGDGIGIIAYPWLASAITRNPLLISLVVVVQRLPWLLFSLPAGVITDRHDRKRLMVTSNTIRAVVTVGIATIVMARQDALPGPDVVSDAATVITHRHGALPPHPRGHPPARDRRGALRQLGADVPAGDRPRRQPGEGERPHVERGTGRQHLRRPAARCAAHRSLVRAAVLRRRHHVRRVGGADRVHPTARNRLSATVAPADGAPTARSWRAELVEGFRWLWSHDLLRTLAITLGLLNLIGTLSTATFVLYGQEVLDTSPTEFAILGTGGAVGGIIGGWTASNVARRIGAGPSLALSLVGGGIVSILIGLMSWWPTVWLLLAAFMFVGTLWNVITVSFRQSVIPDHLLGRVNSVYRFFGWGMMPIGAALGGLIVVIVDQFASREVAFGCRGSSPA